MKKEYGKWQLTSQEISRGETIFMDLFIETRLAGGAPLWFEVFKRLLEEEGYEIVEKKKEK